MEVVGGVSAVWSLVELTGKIIQFLIAVRGASREIKECQREVPALLALLVELEDRYPETDSSRTPVHRIGLDKHDFAEYATILGRIQSKIQNDSIAARLKWKFNKEDIESLLEKTQRLKSSVSIALQLQSL
jgi:hypothetical protein